MREIFSDTKLIKPKAIKFSKFILIAALVIFFLPLVILPFFNHPSTDDYFCGYQLHDKSFWQYQFFIYNNWGGRFAATFAGSLFAYHDFLYNHYYLHSLLLLILNFCSLFLLIHLLDKYVLKAQCRFSKKIVLTFLFLALEISCLVQVSTFIFWFSSAVTYQLPIILIQIEAALLILCFHSTGNSIKIICSFFLPLLIFISTGFSEFFIAAQLFIFILICFFNWHKKYSLLLKIFSVTAYFISSAIMIFSPGNHIRANEVIAKKMYVGIAAVCYHSFETLWSICKNPFFWFIAVFVFLYANNNREMLRNKLAVKSNRKNEWLFLVAIFIFLIGSITLPVALLKGGIIPDRYLNAVTYCFVPLMLLYFFIAGMNTSLKAEQITFLQNRFFIYIFLAAGLLFNNYIIDAYKSMLAAPTYNSILSERENIFKKAEQNNKTATVKDYNAAVSELLQTKYQFSSLTFRQLIREPPPLLFFKDDLADKYTIDILKKYYRLDSIIVEK